MLTEKEFLQFFFEWNNFTISFSFVDINLNSFLHVDVIVKFLHLKQRSCFEKINAFLLIHRNVTFDDKLNKHDLFSKKYFVKTKLKQKFSKKKATSEKATRRCLC